MYSKEQVERLLEHQRLTCGAASVREIVMNSNCDIAELRRLVNIACNNAVIEIPEDIE